MHVYENCLTRSPSLPDDSSFSTRSLYHQSATFCSGKAFCFAKSKRRALDRKVGCLSFKMGMSARPSSETDFVVAGMWTRFSFRCNTLRMSTNSVVAS